MAQPVRVINSPTGGYQLGGYRELPLPEPIVPFAEVAWTYTPVRDRTVEHLVIPETGVSLCVFIGESPRATSGDVELVLMGSIQRPRRFVPDPAVSMAAIRLKAEWSAGILGIQPADCVDALGPVPSTVRRWLGRHEERLLRSRDAIDAVRILTRCMLSLADANRRTGTSVAHPAMDMVRTDAAARMGISRIARCLGVSERHLRRSVGDATGIGLKYFSRVRRLHLAVSAADASTRASWTRVALDAGYYDQAHMINEFRDLTGLTPQALLAGRSAQRTD